MSKIANLVVGCGVAGVAGTAGAVTYVYSTKQVNTIKSKYSASLISTIPNNDAIWTKRWEKLKATSAKVLSNNGKLKKAQESRSSSTFSEDIKVLVKGGCEEIYNSEPNENNLADFKAYCSLWLQDKITGFITEQHSDSKWQAKVNGLKNYTKGLVSELTTIKNAITDSNVGEQQQKIKELCDKLKENMFESETATEFNNTKSFCTSAAII